jgi:G3E family GTPase
VSAALDFVVLTGFLGSGKTTLLRDFLATEDAAGTAVIVNEVGEIGLDGAILAEATGDLRMAMLANGCVCCALGSDLAVTVEQLVDSQGALLRRVVLETSGLSKPGPILRGLTSLTSLSLRVSVIATFDCLRGSQVARFEEAAAQWAGAQALVLTRRDLASPSQLEAARAMAHSINPIAEVIDCDDRGDCVRTAFGRRPPAPQAVPNVAGPPHPRIAVMLVRWLAKPAWDDLAVWLDNLSGLLGERLLRVKGVVEVAELEQPLLIQSVGTMFSPPRRFAGPVDTQFLVVIARDTSPDELVQIAPVMPVVINRLGVPDPFARRSSAPWRAR